MLRYVTSNPGKAREAAARLGEAVDVVDLEYLEPQADDVVTVAAHGAETAFAALDGDDPVLVDDAGLFIDPLGGFPGHYSAYVEETLGIERVADLARQESDPSAAFRAAIAYADGDRVETFTGAVTGQIVTPRGDGGFGYDPIFEHGHRTFAEMTVEEKNACSHRGRALDRFTSWYHGSA